MRISIAEAKAQLAELIRRVEAGDEIELTRYGRPVARLTAAHRPAQRLIGSMKGQFTLPDDIGARDEDAAQLFRESLLFPK